MFFDFDFAYKAFCFILSLYMGALYHTCTLYPSGLGGIETSSTLVFYMTLQVYFIISPPSGTA